MSLLLPRQTSGNAIPVANAALAGNGLEGFGAHLVSESQVSALALSRAERAASKTGSRLDRVLVELGLMSERDMACALARFLGCVVFAVADVPIACVLPDLIPSSFVKSSSVMPVRVGDGRLVVAAVDPLNDEALKALAYLTDLTVEVCVVCPSDFEQMFAALYENNEEILADDDTWDQEGSGDDLDVQRLRDNASEAPVIKLVNQIVRDAIEARASDVHLEPFDEVLQVRFRIDGTLRVAQSVPASLRAAVVSRVKIMARLDIAERRLPQDGRLRITVRGVDVDFRIATIPTGKGESVVMRILDRSRVSLDFETLGFEPDEIHTIRDLLRQPNGIVLVTGPTGSGKTTTLYAALKELGRDDIKIFTVEDPIEYQLNGVNQVQVQPSIGLDFPHALRSILRHDPDVIMVGEIRDAETAKIAVQAALTGHLVLSTLHTNNAASAITRLLDMGIEAFLLASTVRGVVAQRLVRRRCTCSMSGDLAASFRDRSLVCPSCNGTGLAGRSTIAEILIVDSDLGQVMLNRGSSTDIEAVARRKGMRTMYEAGLVKVGRDVTTIQEVARVTKAV